MKVILSTGNFVRPISLKYGMSHILTTVKIIVTMLLWYSHRKIVPVICGHVSPTQTNGNVSEKVHDSL